MELISRDKALMNARPEYLNPNQEKLASYNQGWNNAIEMYCRQIAELPIVEERKEGRWIDKGRDDDVYDIKGVKTWATKGMCSECGFTTWFIESHMCYAYCPQCGSYNATKMKGE